MNDIDRDNIKAKLNHLIVNNVNFEKLKSMANSNLKRNADKN